MIKRTLHIAFLVGLLTICTAVLAQVKTPALSEEQKLKVQNVLQEIQIAQLHAQLAQQELSRAQLATQMVLQPLVVKGFRLNLDTLEYVAEVPAAPTPSSK